MKSYREPDPDFSVTKTATLQILLATEPILKALLTVKQDNLLGIKVIFVGILDF